MLHHNHFSKRIGRNHLTETELKICEETEKFCPTRDFYSTTNI